MKLPAYFTVSLILGLSASFAHPCILGGNKALQRDVESVIIAESWKYESLGKDLVSSEPNDQALTLLLHFYGPAPAWSEEDMEAQSNFPPEENGNLIEARTGGDLNARI